MVICSNALRTRQTYDVLRQELPELEDADSHFHGSLYTVAALDGQTRARLTVSGRGGRAGGRWLAPGRLASLRAVAAGAGGRLWRRA